MVEGKNLLISGGTGYLGSHFLNSLKEANVFIIDRNIKKNRLKQEANLYIEKNIEQINLDDIPTNIDKFIHTSYCRNLKNEKKLLELVSQKNPKVEIIFFSSSAVYGDLYSQKKVIFKTSDIANPVNDYGRYKLELENFIKGNFTNYKILRISNPYGKEYEEKGVYQLFKTKIYKSLETNYQASFTINYPQAMTMFRDMIFIDDTIKQILSAYNLGKHGIFNISSGKAKFLEDFAYKTLQDFCTENNLSISKFKLNFTYRKKTESEIIQSVLEPTPYELFPQDSYCN